MFRLLTHQRFLAALLALALLVWTPAAYATDAIHDYDADTPGNNVSIGGISFAENMNAAAVNNGVRELVSQIKRAIADQGDDIASASTTAVCSSDSSIFAQVTGTTTITSLGTAAAGCWRWIEFTGALLLTHNATSLILPGGQNITTAAGDAMAAVSLGSGNWKVLVYSTAAGNPVGSFSTLTATSTDTGATAGPDVNAFRNSASPADNDKGGRFVFEGRDSAANQTDYASIDLKILDVTDGTEDAEIEIPTIVAGTSAARVVVGQGLRVGPSATGGDCGTGCINVDTDIQLDGVSIAHGVAQVVVDTNSTYTTLGTILPLDNSIPQNTEGVEILSVEITPKNASSTLTIEFTGSFGGSSLRCSAALFVDSTANALNANGITISNSGQMNTIAFNHVVSAGSTSARTYKIRAGSDVAADCFLNGDSVSRQYGGIATATLIVTEILP